jgi:hypothetical protein
MVKILGTDYLQKHFQFLFSEIRVHFKLVTRKWKTHVVNNCDRENIEEHHRENNVL